MYQEGVRYFYTRIEYKRRQAGAELCQAQQNLESVDLVVLDVIQVKIYKNYRIMLVMRSVISY